MPNFSHRPPDEPSGYGLPLIRTPANGRLILNLMSDKMIGCPTHWYGGRTIPCEGENCDACQDGYSWRWHGYVAGLIYGTRRAVIAEFTAQASEQIAIYRDAQGTLRGAILQSNRHRNRHNGRVLITMKPGDLAAMNLPPEPDLVKALSIIWNLPKPDLIAADHVKGVPRIFTRPDKPSNNQPRVKRETNPFILETD